ncbi:MAG: RNA polymerase factor sigma-32 [Rhizobiales bacterium NRL2]|jgi:RNA polymerase sigma-32 factor|nr:MAG: RNA polymerase factor sigma-32 [Rhizobiales bacterium NRL2]
MIHDDSIHSARQEQRFISTAMSTPLLSHEHEQDLAFRWRDNGDERALHELVQAYMRLVVSIASKFRAYGLPRADMVQEGCVGLMQAAARFEPERGVRFSTYATWWIRSSMQEYVLRNWSIVRSGTSAAQKALFFNLRRLRAQIDGAGATALSEEARETISQRLKVSVREVTAMSDRLSSRDQSLNAPAGEESTDEWGDFLVDDRPSPEEVSMRFLDGGTRGRWLKAALDDLTDRERLIVTERKLNEEKVTLEELGEQLGVTKERVRQIEHKALQKLSDGVLRRAREAAGGKAGGELAA